MDVIELIKTLVMEIPTLQGSPLYLVGESYGGKLAAMIGAAVARSIHAGSLNINLGGKHPSPSNSASQQDNISLRKF
jgi:serine carboxypeptidase 1